jgi:hypothetical protein
MNHLDEITAPETHESESAAPIPPSASAGGLYGSATEVYEALKALGVQVSLQNDGRLRVMPWSVVGQELREVIPLHRAGLVALVVRDEAGQDEDAQVQEATSATSAATGQDEAERVRMEELQRADEVKRLAALAYEARHARTLNAPEPMSAYEYQSS